MAVSIRLALLSLATTILILCFFFTRTAAVASAVPDGDSNAVENACHGESSDKGDQCTEQPSGADDDEDDDFDDTYKFVDNVAVKLSASGSIYHWVEKA